MSISLNNQESRATVTHARLRRLAADAIAHRLVIEVEFGYIVSGAITVVRSETLLYTDETTPTFAQAVNAIPALVTTQTQIEDLLAAGPVPGTRI